MSSEHTVNGTGPSPNGTKTRWTAQRERAAELIAHDTLTDEQIAATVGISKRSLERWKHDSQFRARVAEYTSAARDRIMAAGVALKERRVKSLNERWLKLQQVISERAADPTMQDVPGGTTGILVRTAKLIKVYEATDDGSDEEMLYSAKRDVLVSEYAVDTALLKELRDIEKQAAQELGEWDTKKPVGSLGVMVPGNDGPVTFTIQIDRQESADDSDQAE